MAAGLGFKDFQTGEVLTAADVDGYLMQGIWVFADATARDAAVTSPQEGNACYLKDTNQVLTYSGSAWVAVGGGSIPANNGAEINTAQNTTSTSYTDLTTAGPAVTVTTGTKALVIITSELSHDATGVPRVSFAVSGATTQAANDDYDLHSQGSNTFRFSSASYVTLTAGSNTFTMKYRVNSGTGYFSDRQIFVMNMA
jgi:hypothetical protein